MTIEQVVTFSPQEALAIKQLAQKIGPNHKPLTDNDIHGMISSPSTFIFLAKDDGTISGMIALIVYRIPYAKKAIIEDLIVDEKYRGQGIGNQLVTRALAEASDQGVAYVDLSSRPERIASNGLYERLGFKKRDTNVYRLVL